MPTIVEMSPAGVDTYAKLFPGPHAAMVVASIAAGNTAAQLWQIEQPSGEALLLWDKGNNVFYLAGAPLSAASCRLLGERIATEIRPRTLGAGRPYFKTRALAPQLESALPAIFDGIGLREAPTLFFSLPDGVSPTAVAVAGIRFAAIDRALLASDLANLEPVKDEIGSMWPSPERFYEHGFGYAALDGAQVVCFCTAEYVSAERCGIGIATELAYQRRGIATATAARFVQLAHERGVAPHWECGGWNAASIRVAQKLGFARVAEERYWIGTFDQ